MKTEKKKRGALSQGDRKEGEKWVRGGSEKEGVYLSKCRGHSALE